MAFVYDARIVNFKNDLACAKRLAGKHTEPVDRGAMDL
jgi:hypothetical protein